MPGADGKAVAGGQASKACALEWPTRVSADLTTFAVDQHMIAFYDGRPHAEVEAFQFKLISQLLSHAAKHSEWWRERLRSARGGKAVQFRRLPLMTRDQFRIWLTAAKGPLSLPAEHGQASKVSTSGSSGIPVSLYSSALASRMNRAHYSYDRIRQSINSDHLVARITSRFDSQDMDCRETRPNHVLNISRERIRGIKNIAVEDHARWLADIKPAYIVANAGLLEAVLDAYEDRSVEPPAFGTVKALLSYSETVTRKFRSQAEAILGSQVLDRYSCEEVGPLAFQCPVSDEYYHIAATNALVEVLDENGVRSRPGEVGRVYVTGLHNYASPVVRYELGDLAAWRPQCVCGYDKPVLTRLLGRIRFLIRLPSGERKHVRVKAKDWLAVAPFHETRIVQVSKNVIRAECVLGYAMTIQEKAKAEAMLRRAISPDLTYEVVQLERIDWGPTYKRQDVVSLI